MTTRSAVPGSGAKEVSGNAGGENRELLDESGPRELRLLLIEDSSLLRSRLIGMLEVPGVINVQEWAETERDAAARIDSAEFDVLVVDVELKQGSGISVIRHARKAYAGRKQPLIVVLTNYALPTVQQRCMSAGADVFLDKMQQFDELRPIIERYGRERGN